MIVATAGHIDHGKTLLVKMLTGVDTDRLPEEKARGISIDLGFAYWPLADGGLIGFVDVPGHERFIHNMLAGVCGIDFALLAVAADDGVMPQTVEHLQILSLLGIDRGVAVITKIDRVDSARIDEVRAQLQALLAGSALAAIAVLPVCAVTGAGIDALREALLDAAKAHSERYREGQHFRLAIDRAFAVAGSGTVVTGTVFNGELRPGDRLMVSPKGVPARVRGIQIRGKTVERAQAGDRCAINLSGIDAGALGRGDWLLHESIHTPSRRLDVRFTLLPAEKAPLRHWAPVHLHLATADVMARVAIRRGGAIVPGTAVLAQLVTAQPIAALNGDRFILRDPSASRTLGGGKVIDPLAQANRRASAPRPAVLSALEQEAPEAALADLLSIPGHAVDCRHFETLFDLTAERAASLYRSADAAIIGREARVAIARASACALGEHLLARLGELHRAQPQTAGINLPALRRELAPWLTADAFSFLVRGLADAHKVHVSGSAVRLAGYDAASNSADEALWRAVLPALLEGRFSPPKAAELAHSLGQDEATLRSFLHRKSASGEVMRVGEDLFYPKATLATLAANAALVARSASRGLFTAAQYRDATGLGRNLAIRLLEFFDTLGITQRIGDARKMHKNFVPILGPAKPSFTVQQRPRGRA
ncbi:MAG: selenocysteine-specific translation elongation factor [Betaproteobacteria bacterium RIFCSPLOWO2_12_FULL_67_28]|nr:MAG: selenocysteine-specific translation elongation factor [Betaproteobacteria bacterium RIFCSPLOWO2_12_FULL_67_28]